MQEPDGSSKQESEKSNETHNPNDQKTKSDALQYQPNFVLVEASPGKRILSAPVIIGGGGVGIAAAVYAIIRLLREIFAGGGRLTETLGYFKDYILISPAFAQSGEVDPLNLRPYILLGVFATLLLVLVWCLIAMLFTKNSKTQHTARDLTKTLVGFFIGVATSFLD